MTAKPKTKTAKPASSAAKPKAKKAKAAEAPAPAPAEAAAETKSAKAKSAKAKAAKEVKPKGPAGVKLTVTMPYICGQIIKKHGLAAGVTESMVREADALAGRSNPHQTWFNLRNAFHSIRAFVGDKADTAE